MAQDDTKEPGKFVQVMQSPSGVVTNRVLQMIGLAVIGWLVTAYGNAQSDAQKEIRKGIELAIRMGTENKLSIATMEGRVNEQGDGISRNSAALDRQGEHIGALDTRVTILEHKGAR